MNDYRWEDLDAGLAASFSVEITDGMLASFRTLSGDSNPLHCDAEYARRAGFAGVVVPGLLAASFYSALVGVHLPGKSCLLHGIDILFSKPVYSGDQLTVSGEISHLNQACRQAEIRARIQNGAGTVSSKAKIRVGVRP
jgi:3-hydroxybutyryl-CoA dehydratase